MASKNLIYLAHGNELFLYETLFSIVSFYHYHPDSDIKITVYTDRPDFFHTQTGGRVATLAMDPETIKKWSGPEHFVHLVKIEMLRDFVSRCPGEKYLYLDSDTVFTGTVEKVFQTIGPSSFAMHLNEGDMYKSKAINIRRLARFLRSTAYHSAAFDMWNAGVIGFDDAGKYILDEVLATTHLLYPRHHTHIMEQFAFSWHFQKEGTLQSTDHLIYHYWFAKKFRDIIAAFFEFYKEERFEVWVEKYGNLRPEHMLQQVYAYKFGTFAEKMKIRLSTFSKGKIKKVQWDQIDREARNR